jgi:hypothetical protein
MPDSLNTLTNTIMRAQGVCAEEGNTQGCNCINSERCLPITCSKSLLTDMYMLSVALTSTYLVPIPGIVSTHQDADALCEATGGVCDVLTDAEDDYVEVTAW